MPRRNVWIPDALDSRVRAELPRLNLSEVVRDALASRLDCRHEHAECVRCSRPIDTAALVDAALSAFYADALWELGRLLDSGGTIEGAARVLKELAMARQVSTAPRLPLPRPTRAQRQRNEPESTQQGRKKTA